MSRVAAYLGPLAPVATVVEQGTYPLAKQAASAPDGFGVGWYPDDGQEGALRLVSRSPIWAEEHLLKVARRLRSRCVLAGLRRCPPGTVPELSGAQPFDHGPFLFHHVGELSLFREVFERPLREKLGDRAHRSIAGTTDSELLFATWLDALGDRRGPDAMADALEKMLARVRQISHANGTPASFSVLASDGSALVALRSATHGSPPPLHTIVTSKDGSMPQGARIIASEPLFPGAWTALEDHSLTIFTPEA
jgi:predicted glutamine amidotransferase